MPHPVTAATYYSFLAGLATYVALLPSVTQLKVMETLRHEDPGHFPYRAGAIGSNHTKLAFVVAFLFFIVQLCAPLMHRVSPRVAPPKPIITPTEIRTEFAAFNASRANTAYVHLFVENIITRAISKQHEKRLWDLQKTLLRMVKGSREMNAGKIRLLERDIEEQKRRIHTITSTNAIQRLDKQIQELEIEVEMLHKTVLNQHRNISNRAAREAAQKSLIASQKSQLAAMSNKILMHR